ncbi:protein translocase subunit SecD [Streptomyces sp. ST2-7A]|uniref:protein translocase subunit SecD n=1 Tax=Streptomyces sp. ST2-7A TaxID=2907214 RepID=UPI001F43FB45|nr:protein translocase subunit SecD [Streptomyces sp. ST2-7A]MCE7079722.1 protein translocase subunit SecD [Streptomyces sp. ST2-7A]
MAGPNQDFRSPRKDLRSSQAKPGRALLALSLLAVLLTGGMFLTGANTPRLGIDLAGGTSITLSATEDSRNDGAVTEENLATAVDIIERRVNGLGVSEATVQSQGDRNIVVNIPQGTDETQAREQVGTTAQLGFRQVLSVQPAFTLPEGEEGGEPGDAENGEGDGETAEEPGTEGDAEESGEESGENDGDSTDQSLRAPGAPAGATTVTNASFRTDETTDEAVEETDGTDEGTAQEDGEESEEDGAPGEGEEGFELPEAESGLAAELAALDCSTPEARQEARSAAADAPDENPIVACDEEGFYKYELGPVAVPGTDITGADSVYDTQQGLGWIVTMDFNSEGARKFADITAQLATEFEPRNQFAIVLDGEVRSAPRVSERLGGGSAMIQGNFDSETAGALANVLKFGALPITFEIANVNTVSPTLGSEQLRAGLIAGGIGLALVVGYLVFYYRALSVIAVSSLILMAGLTYVIMTLLGPAIGFALSLPAICGAIVAVGITADSFIVYFERVRDEVRAGRPIRAAIERGWPRARRTIIVSDVVSFLSAIVLFLVSVGSVQGFAFVLGLTTALDLLIVFLLTKPMLTLAGRRKFFARGHKWSGLDPKRLGARPPIRRTGRRPVPVTAEPKEA